MLEYSQQKRDNGHSRLATMYFVVYLLNVYICIVTGGKVSMNTHSRTGTVAMARTLTGQT